jgi:hypothetical protein
VKSLNLCYKNLWNYSNSLKQKENSIAVEFLKGFESVRIEVALNGLESNKVTKTRNTEAIVFIWLLYSNKKFSQN